MRLSNVTCVMFGYMLIVRVLLKNTIKVLSYISGAVTNVAYYCEYNHCYSRIKQLVTLYINSNTDPTTVSTSPHQEESSAQPFNLSSKVGNLTEQTLQLETWILGFFKEFKSGITFVTFTTGWPNFAQ